MPNLHKTKTRTTRYHINTNPVEARSSGNITFHSVTHSSFRNHRHITVVAAHVLRATVTDHRVVTAARIRIRD